MKVKILDIIVKEERVHTGWEAGQATYYSIWHAEAEARDTDGTRIELRASGDTIAEAKKTIHDKLTQQGYEVEK